MDLFKDYKNGIENQRYRLPFVVCRKRHTIHKAINKCFIDQVCLVKMNGIRAVIDYSI